MRDAIEKIAVNPNLSTDDEGIGRLIEELEPQVRHSVIDLRRKGYQTVNSGFGNIEEREQFIEIENMPKLDKEILRQLRELNCNLRSGENNTTTIYFHTEESDTLETLRQK